MTLLVWTRCYRHIGGAAQESVNEAAEAQQVFQGAGALRVLRRAGGSYKIRPFGGNQGLAAVR